MFIFISDYQRYSKIVKHSSHLYYSIFVTKSFSILYRIPFAFDILGNQSAFKAFSLISTSMIPRPPFQNYRWEYCVLFHMKLKITHWTFLTNSVSGRHKIDTKYVNLEFMQDILNNVNFLPFYDSKRFSISSYIFILFVL